MSFYYHDELVGLLSQSVRVYVWSWTFKLKKAASVDRYTLILSALDDNILYNTAILMPVHCSDLKKKVFVIVQLVVKFNSHAK